MKTSSFRLNKFLLILAFIVGTQMLTGQTQMSSHDQASSRYIPGSETPAEPFEINKPGTYWLNGNRFCKGTGIIINTSNVTIDFCGYELKGPGKDSGENYGVLTNNHSNLEFRNGTIREFGDRGIVDRGIQQPTANKTLVNMRVLSNGGCGVCIGGAGNLIKNCTFSHNAVSGVCPGYRCIVTENSCHNNEHAGIHAGRGSHITNNNVAENGHTGIIAYCGSTVTNNTVYANNQSQDSTQAGIIIQNGCLIKDNTVRNNQYQNMLVEGLGNMIKDNVVTAEDSTGMGIYLKNKNNLLLGNYFSGNENDMVGDLP